MFVSPGVKSSSARHAPHTNKTNFIHTGQSSSSSSYSSEITCNPEPGLVITGTDYCRAMAAAAAATAWSGPAAAQRMPSCRPTT
eukprot:7167607-Prymnesium_polylepis.1